MADHPDNAALLPLRVIFALGEVLWTHGVVFGGGDIEGAGLAKPSGRYGVVCGARRRDDRDAASCDRSVARSARTNTAPLAARPGVSFAAFGGGFGCIETLAGCPALAVARHLRQGFVGFPYHGNFPAGDGGALRFPVQRPQMVKGHWYGYRKSDNVSLIPAHPHEDAATSSLSYCSMSCCASSYLRDATAFRRVR